MRLSAFILTSVICLMPVPAMASAQLDTAVTEALGKKLDEYILAIGKEPAQVKCEEVDFLIGSCSDSLVRQFTALKLYSGYVESKLMGDETVAIHIYDRWFAPGEVKMHSEIDFLNARIFAEFNRQSLIGNRAPELVMEDMDGRMVSLFGDTGYGGRLSVLFFYDSGCPTCKAESIMLRNILGESKYKVDFYAVYTGQSKEAWLGFISGYLRFDNPGCRVVHLWDPEVKSGYQMKYGILQTPGLFLVSKTGVILGRKLDSFALKQLLDIYCSPAEYGSEESAAFYDMLFSGYGKNPGCSQVKSVCDGIASRTLAKGDTLSFRQMTGDLMYWLGSNRGEGLKCGLGYLIDRYIEGERGVWTDSGDSLKVLAYAGILKDLLGKGAEGRRLPAIEVSGTMKSRGKDKTVETRLDRLRDVTVIFYTEGCNYCREELHAADSISRADRKAKFLAVDIDAVIDSSADTAGALFDSLDLSVLPYITTVDRKGCVTRKYVSLYDAAERSSGAGEP